MPNLNSLQGHQANLARSGFDMGQEFGFTSSTGMILPVYQDLLNVGETVYFTGDFFGRTQPLATAAMADVDVYLDWFFVPLSMLYTLWPSLRYQTNDLLSSLYSGSMGQASNGNLPLLSFATGTHLTPENFNKYVAFDIFNSGGLNVNGESYGKGLMRLQSHFGMSGETPLPSQVLDSPNTLNPSVFPMFPLAYQAIYQDYYRLPYDDYLRRDITAFNVDKYYTGSIIAATEFPNIMALRYRGRGKDYFNSVFVNPVFSSVNALGTVDQTMTQQALKNVHDYLNTSGSIGAAIAGGGNATAVIGRTNNDYNQVASSNSVYNNSVRVTSGQIRDIFALEKMLRILGRAKKDYDSQVLAHFGFKVEHDVKHQLTHIFGQHGLLHIGEVTSMADTFTGNSGSALGQISGKGYVNISGGKPRKFTAPVDGILMCCYSSAVRPMYVDTFDKQNSVTTMADVFTPEYDKLGMQPLFGYEQNPLWFGQADPNHRIGWQFRYSQYKRKYNRATVAFTSAVNQATVNQNSPWFVGKRPLSMVYDSSGNYNAHGYIADPATYPYLFLASPHDLDGIMLVPYQPGYDFSNNGYNYSTQQWSNPTVVEPGALFYTDPFINVFRARVKKVSTMSPYGEPDLDGI